ncbi:MAG: hypothetical protein GY861_21355 [bacterium]|nr:hypothetical protein [bacterium]
MKRSYLEMHLLDIDISSVLYYPTNLFDYYGMRQSDGYYKNIHSFPKGYVSNSDSCKLLVSVNPDQADPDTYSDVDYWGMIVFHNTIISHISYSYSRFCDRFVRKEEAIKHMERDGIGKAVKLTVLESELVPVSVIDVNFDMWNLRNAGSIVSMVRNGILQTDEIKEAANTDIFSTKALKVLSILASTRR